jgi:hypothetical protein
MDMFPGLVDEAQAIRALITTKGVIEDAVTQLKEDPTFCCM